MDELVKQIAKMCDGMDYLDSPSDEAIKLAKDNNCIIVRGRSDDLMQVYGVDCELTENRGHGEHYCFNGSDFNQMKDPDNYDYEGCPDELIKEIDNIGLKVWWCGGCEGNHLEGYTGDMGCFTYTIKDDVDTADFYVIEDDEVYCTGKVIQLP